MKQPYELSDNMTKVKPSRSLEDLRWLVDSRSRNQQSAVELYRLFQEYRKEIAVSHKLTIISQALLGANFSLWRAVFLSDIETERGLAMADAELFLKNLIENNTVAYQQDKNANHWTFRYYVSSSRNIFRRIMDRYPKMKLIADLKEEEPGMDAREWWSLHQDLLDEAITNFEIALDEAADKIADDD